jgi:hypothetical protein
MSAGTAAGAGMGVAAVPGAPAMAPGAGDGWIGGGSRCVSIGGF